MTSLMADSDVGAGGVERHGGLERADRARVDKAKRRQSVAQQLSHHVQAVLGNGDTGGRDAGAQLVHRQLGTLRVVGHGVLLRGSNDTHISRASIAWDGIRSARLNLLEAFSQAMIAVSSTSASSP